MTQTAADREETRFQSEIARSNAATLAVIGWLWRRTSWYIMAKPAIARPAGANPAGENTIADVFISKDAREPWLPIEVKHRHNITWGCAGDYPYPSILLDRVKPRAEPLFYFIVNRAMTHMVIVPVERVKHQLLTLMVNDRGKAGGAYEGRFCPTGCDALRWEKF